MLTDSQSEDLFVEPKGWSGLKLVAAASALAVTAAVFAGYTYLRKRHAEQVQPNPSNVQSTMVEQKGPPKAQIFVDDALMQGSQTLIGGTVKNISAEKLEGLAVELELRRRKDGVSEKRAVPVDPSQLEPGQEGRYSLQLRSHEYASVRFAGFKGGPNLLPLAYTIFQGQKRPPERLGTKTITVGKQPARRDEFLNGPDKPVRVP